MSNANRDYAIVYDIKNSSLVLSRPLNFYITDKNTSNIFIKLVTRVIVGNGIDQYTDIENASNYVLTMRVIKPNNEVKSLEATQHEPENIFQFDLTEDFKDIPGKYICELTISTIVNSKQELITSDPFSYEVKRSILSNVGEIIETENTTVEKLLNDLEATKAELSSQIKERATKQELAVEKARIDNLAILPEGSTTGDAELIDGRVGFDGITYKSLGQSVRTQIGKLSNELFSNPRFNQLNLTFVEGYYNMSGSIVTGSGKFRSEIKVKVGETYKISGASFWQMPMYVLLDSNGTLKSTFPTTTTSETYEKEVNIIEDGTLIINYTYDRSGNGVEYKPKVYKKIYNSEMTQLKNDISTVNDNVNITNTTVSKIKDLIYTDNYISLDLKFKSGATSINGSLMGGNSYYHCDIEIDVNCKYKVTGYNFWQMPLYLILDEEGNILDTYPKTTIEGGLIEKEISSFPTGSKTLRINYTSSYAGTGEEFKSKAYKTSSIFDDTPIKNIGKTSNLTNIFSKYGIIGDSLSCGAQDIEDGTNAVDMPQFSWATFLEKASGCETVRLAKGGLQLKNWHNFMEQKARLEENKCSAYIIMLGHNDPASEVGTISDIDLENLSNSNTNTQFGMYGKLIGTLREINPKCKIFCVTYPIYYVENFGTNEIPRTLPDYINNCYCIDLWKYDKNRSESHNTDFAIPNPHFAKTHGTILGYKNWANIIDSYIDYIIRNNMKDFSEVAYIETDKTFN